MLYISGAIAWTAAWVIPLRHEPAWVAYAAAFSSWIGLCMWELAMRENRKAVK